MAHEIDNTKGFSAIAYKGDTPWHKLGQQMQAGQTIEQWQTAAGMDFQIDEVPALYRTKADSNIYRVSGKKVLVRSDSGDSLAIVSNGYKVVQPKEVLEFYRDLTAKAGFELETAGVLRGGRKYWALASMGKEAKIMDDTIKGYLLLGTACDGSMATTAMFTSVRVVCNNTLGFAMNEAESGKAKNVVRVSHRSVFDDEQVKAQLGLAGTSWSSFLSRVSHWSDTHVTQAQAQQFCDTMSTYETTDGDVVVSKKISEKLMALYSGQGRGSELKSAKNTVWGLINSVTEYIDHHRGRTADVRMDRALFGDGISTKEKAITLAESLITV